MDCLPVVGGGVAVVLRLVGLLALLSWLNVR